MLCLDSSAVQEIEIVVNIWGLDLVGGLGGDSLCVVSQACLSQCGESPHWERPEKPQPHYKVRSMELPEGVCSSDSESVARR